jgi:hypothetical protein
VGHVNCEKLDDYHAWRTANVKKERDNVIANLELMPMRIYIRNNFGLWTCSDGARRKFAFVEAGRVALCGDA